MGWNDRLVENPYPPYEDSEERDRYDAWAAYLEECRKEEGLTSQNIDPARLTELLGKANGQEIPEEQRPESTNCRIIEDTPLPF